VAVAPAAGSDGRARGPRRGPARRPDARPAGISPCAVARRCARPPTVLARWAPGAPLRPRWLRRARAGHGRPPVPRSL